MLVAVVVVIVVVIVGIALATNGGSKKNAGAETPRPTASAAPTSVAPATPAMPEPTATGAPMCNPNDVTVGAITDAATYAADTNPKLSFSLTNKSGQKCQFNAGTGRQEYSITMKGQKVWDSMDCQSNPQQTLVTIDPGKTIVSQALEWNREKSSKDTCSKAREKAAAGGASYELVVTVDGVKSAAKQFLLM